jgi:Cu(I)/Ag(I) efflux system membrane fusion protein
MKKFILFVFVLAVGMLAGALLYRYLLATHSAAPAAPGAAQARGQRKILYYVDPMHPAYKSDKPGIAPDCGMKLEPVYEEAGGAAAANVPAESMPPGAINISPEKQQLIGVKYGEVHVMPLSRTIRAVGIVSYDETKIARIHTRVDGWIEQVMADFTGDVVKKGQPLLSIYSPELLATQQEFLLARKAQGDLADSPIKEATAGAEALYAAARKRLELWDVTDEQIQEILRRNAPIKTMTVFSPVSGYVLTRNAFPRQRVTSDTELYTIADLSTVWVLAEVYEYEAQAVQLGQSVRITLPSFPGQSLWGKVSYILPKVDATARTIKVRIELPNPGLRLKPDMYANAELAVDYGRRLAVPAEAVLDAGLAKTVFVDRGNGYLEPRQVELGEKVGDDYIVLGGLKQGERVVTSGNFLVDSESRLKSAAGAMGAMPGMEEKKAPAGQTPAPPGGHRHD